MKNIKAKNLIFCGCIIFTLICIAFAFGMSAIMHDSYDMPKIKNGVMDMHGEAFESFVGSNLNGEWDFYYNKWIVSDELYVKPDGLIEFGKSWSGMEIDGEKITSNGYASYSMTVKNVPALQELYFSSYHRYNGLRIYINNELVHAYGDMSKKPSAEFDDFTFYNRHYITEKQEDLEIVVEVSSGNVGGVTKPIWLRTLGFNISYISVYAIMMYAMLGILFAFVWWNFMVAISMDKMYRNMTFAWFVLALFMRFVVGVDGQALLFRHDVVIPYTISTIATAITTFVAIAIFIVMSVEYGFMKWSRSDWTTLTLGYALMYLATYLLRGYSFVWLPGVVFFVGLMAVVKRLLSLETNAKRRQTMFAVIFTVIISALIIEHIDLNGGLNMGTDSYSTYGVFLIIVLTSIDNLRNLRKVQNEWVLSKEQFLRSQMTPHYIFNILNSIKSEYHEDIKRGDLWLKKFSDNLRKSINLQSKELVKFKDEIENIKEQVELMNFARDRQVIVKYAIEEDEFLVPTFSFQPIVENAIKYSCVQYKQNGCVTISSKLVGDNYLVKVSDNGIGFDVEDIGEKSTGIKNAKMRFNLLLGSELEIKSEKGIGTTVVVKIKKR